MMMFQCDPRLEKDSVFVCALALCEVRLHINAAYPWLILVPRRPGACEIFDLGPQDQALLMEETAHAARVLKDLVRAHKINVGALGNIVPQLHMHVVARFQDDPAWPGPVWGAPTTKAYGDEGLEIFIGKLTDMLGAR